MDYKEKYEALLAENEDLKVQPKKKDESPEQIGRDLYQDLKQRGKIRGGKLNDSI
ncbi:hypothetical protein Q0N12_16410 [Rossellomorea marisflavi]|uniref:hypothetical protein n=1 Tax=Rossellomorea marisflavi TaxID=189381 RepID=UPI003459ABAD